MPEAPRTLRTLMVKKILDSFEELSLSRTVRNVGMLVLAAALTVLLVMPNLFVGAATMVLGLYNGVVWKFAVACGFVFHFQTAYRFIKRIMRQKPNISLIEGVPAMELLDHIFTFGSFKRDEVCKKFGLSKERFDKLARRLESMQVFERGENNARVLNPDFTRQDVAAILEGKRKAADLAPTLKQVSPNAWTVEPTATIIQDRVDALLDTPPVFAMRRL